MKRIYSLIIAIVLLLTLSTLCFAQTPKIADRAGLLTEHQIADLESRAQALADRYDIDVAIVTTKSLGSKSARDYADDYFDYNGYGIGSDHSGIIFLISTEERDWWISTSGKGIQALTDYGIDCLFDAVSDELAQDQWYDAFSSYLDHLQDYLEAYEQGTPIDKAPNYLLRLAIALVIGAVIGGIAIAVMRSKMNTARRQTGASSYLVDGSYQLNVCRDMYLYGHTSRVRKQENSGSSTHRSSSGRSHGGRGGKF